MKIKKVHVIFKTHLDIGFTDYAAAVVAKYFNSFIPKAIATAYEVNQGRDKPAFIWTTGSWLICEFLRTQPVEQVRKMEEAIRRGYIAWHALPFTTHSELMDTRLLQYGLSLAEELDQRFGRQTIAAKMTDVPGHTIGIVGPLADHGVKYLHIGVNEASTVPDVPDLFVWRDSAGNELIVNYAKTYGAMQTMEGLDEALAFAFTGDNLGPCTAEQVRQSLDQYSAMFPGAEVCASTLDDFARKVLEIKDSLPVIISEIGDTWIHGVGTDPAKVSQYRELLRLRDRWIDEGRMDGQSAEYRAFSGKLLLVPEHTWGMDVKTHLPDFTNYAKPDFKLARSRDAISLADIPLEYSYVLPYADHGLHGASAHSYRTLEASWQEQRGYVRQAIEHLGTEKRAEAEAAMQALQPVRATGFGAAVTPGESYDINGFMVKFGADGSIDALSDDKGNVMTGSTAAFAYQCCGVEDYDYWREHYVRNLDSCFSWAIPDFGKLGFERVNPLPRQKMFFPVSESVSLSIMGNTVRAMASMPEEACTRYGAPREIQTDYVFNKGRVTIEFRWFGKEANRLPEAFWLAFHLGSGTGTLKMMKLGCLVSPYDIVSLGGRNLHVCQSIACHEKEHDIRFISMDAPLVSMKGMDILRFDDKLPEPGGSVYVNLSNNIFGTNFPMWYEEDGKCRFEIAMT